MQVRWVVVSLVVVVLAVLRVSWVGDVASVAARPLWGLARQPLGVLAIVNAVTIVVVVVVHSRRRMAIIAFFHEERRHLLAAVLREGGLVLVGHEGGFFLAKKKGRDGYVFIAPVRASDHAALVEPAD